MMPYRGRHCSSHWVRNQRSPCGSWCHPWVTGGICGSEGSLMGLEVPLWARGGSLMGQGDALGVQDWSLVGRGEGQLCVRDHFRG